MQFMLPALRKEKKAPSGGSVKPSVTRSIISLESILEIFPPPSGSRMANVLTIIMKVSVMEMREMTEPNQILLSIGLKML